MPDDRIGPFKWGGDMDTGEGDPFGLRESVFDTLMADTARQMREQGMCAQIQARPDLGGEDICMYDQPCPIHEPELYSARDVSFWDKFVGLFRR